MAKNTFVAEITFKIRFNKKLMEPSKTKEGFFRVTLKVPFLTLNEIILNFKCYWED